MIKLEHTEVLGWDAAVRGMRNPMNSWEKSDSYWTYIEDAETQEKAKFEFFVGENDLTLMRTLCRAGTDHRKFMRMLTVYVDITAPRYFWEQMATYKIGTVFNSCSTMHKIHAKEFTMDDFSHEHLSESAKELLDSWLMLLNVYRINYQADKDKDFWWQMIQLLPQSYNQKRTVMLNYEVLSNIYKSRKNHKIDEWHDLCHWIEGLPYSELITA